MCQHNCNFSHCIKFGSACIWAGFFSLPITDIVGEFLKSPSKEFLEQCLWKQSVKIARHFELDVGDKRLKEKMKNILQENLIEVGVLQFTSPAVGAPVVNDTDVNSGLTFELHRELL